MKLFVLVLAFAASASAFTVPAAPLARASTASLARTAGALRTLPSSFLSQPTVPVSVSRL